MTALNTLFKKNLFFLVLSALLIGLNAEGMAQQVQSDYEIQKSFKEKYQALNDSLEMAQSSREIKNLIEKIKKLEEKYQEHTDLLNSALYPVTFEEEMESLKRRTVSTSEKLAKIEYQEEELGKLTDQVSSYEVRLDRLSTETESLKTAMQQSSRDEAQMSSLIQQYKENLEERDELILSFVDSVMITYNEMDLSSIDGLENSGRQSKKLSADGDALKMIEGIARENITFLKSAPTLSTEEYLRMNTVQQEFKNMWTTMGDKIAEIYAGDDEAEQAKAQVDKAVNEWDEIISEKTWASLNQAVENENLNIPGFSSKREFFSNLSGYLDNSISSSKDKATEESYNKYQRFRSFWTNQVKVKWADNLVKGDLLTNRQMASIDQKLDEWSISAKPESNNLLVYLLGASVLAVVVLGVMLAREKNNKHS